MSKNGSHRNVIKVFGALALAAGVAGSCSDNTAVPAGTTAYVYDDPYLYTAYYPYDVAYSGYYWADSWNYATFYAVTYGPGGGGTPTTGAAGTNGAGGTTPVTTGAGGAAGATASGGAGGSGGATASTIKAGLVTTIEALARGENVCPGQVTVTPMFATPSCAGGAVTQERNGVNIAFNGCVVSGQTISGTVVVQSNRSASEQTCSATTIITLGHTATFTNLTVSGSNGKLVIPSQTDMGMTSYTYGQSPTALTINTTGELQVFNTAGTMVGDLGYTGNSTYTFNNGQSYKIDGTTTVQEKNGTATATIMTSGLTRSGGCCRPTSGTVTINRTGGAQPGQATWTFGSACGAVTRNNVSATLPNCLL
jgi:hypothetical protein